jgi:hypothetical protein
MPARRAPCRPVPAAVHAARAHDALPPLFLAGIFHAVSIVMPYDPHQSILNILGGQYLERWPDEEARIILNTPVFAYQHRLTALTFLYGNLRNVDLVYAALGQQIGADPRDHDHTHAALPRRSCERQVRPQVPLF